MASMLEYIFTRRPSKCPARRPAGAGDVACLAIYPVRATGLGTCGRLGWLLGPNPKHTPIRMTYLYKQGSNTSVVARSDNRIVLAQDAQLSSIPPDSDEDSEYPVVKSPSVSPPVSSPLSLKRSHRSRASPLLFGNLVFH